VIGNPVRPDVALLAEDKRSPPGRERPVRILVTGGSQGSAFLNRHAPALLRRLSDDVFTLEMRHQAGEDEVEAVRDAYERAGLRASVTSFVDDIASAYRWADFAITCAGAATLSELAIAALPALLVPLSSAARNHQVSNAATFASAAGICWVNEETWRPDALVPKIATLLRHQGLWLDASARLRQAAKPHAGRTLVADCEAAMPER
jgi:UDP-N-acetylglucosamine--N-acetylmuramyl-(pentapeptide) pyrophosphoryl-undecaprenol N-acetylglucosamine transferase